MGSSSDGHERNLNKSFSATAGSVIGFCVLIVVLIWFPLMASANAVVIDVATGEVQSVKYFVAPPLNGLGLLVAGVLLLALEAHLFTFGALGALGVAAISAGLLLWYVVGGISLSILIPTIALFALIAIGLVVVGYRTRQMKFGHGVDSLIGRKGVVMEANESRGMVSVHGEIWAFEIAEGTRRPQVGDNVDIVNQKNLVLVISKSI